MPNNAEAWNVKGWSSISIEQNNDAISAFTKYISLKPDISIGYSIAPMPTAGQVKPKDPGRLQ